MAPAGAAEQAATSLAPAWPLLDWPRRARFGTLWQALAGFSRPSFPSFLHQKKPPTPAASTAENRSSGKSLNGCSHKRKQVRRLDLSLR